MSRDSSGNRARHGGWQPRDRLLMLVVVGRLTLPDLLDEPDPRILALADVARRGLTYSQLREQSARVRDLLARRGIGLHDTVAVALPNGAPTAALLTALVGCCRIAPLNLGYTRSEFAFALRDTGAMMLITSDTLPQALTAAAECAIEVMHMIQLGAQPGTFELHGELPTMARAVESRLPEPDDLALVLHTSGTTSRP